MTLPQSNWSRKDKSSVGGATASPRYFYFEDSHEASLQLSGWFEPEHRFKGVRAMWEQDSKSFKESRLPEPANFAFEKLGGWDTVTKDFFDPAGSIVADIEKSNGVSIEKK